MQKLGICLKETEINDYLSGALPEEKRAGIEGHLKNCENCLDKLAFAYQAVKGFNRINPEGVKIMKSNWKKNLWLFGAVIAFALSFLVPRYFVQLLVAAIFLGSKWIFDSVNARILIMIYEAWKKGDKEGASKILDGLSDRFNR